MERQITTVSLSELLPKYFLIDFHLNCILTLTLNIQYICSKGINKIKISKIYTEQKRQMLYKKKKNRGNKELHVTIAQRW